MKRLLLLFVLVCTLYSGYSQSTRLVLLEEFTSSTCGPCAGVNPGFHTWQVQNPDKFTSIYYHVNWPSPGDPMNLANPSENGARVSYYAVTYVPESNLDGNYYNGSASSWNMTTINNRQAMPSPISINVQHALSAGQDSVFSTMLIKCTQSFQAPMVAHNVIIEKWIHFNSPPGSNGEKDFYNVMKKMLPGSNGTLLPSSMNAGDYIILEGAWKFGTVYDKTQIASVGFVQNKSTKEIYNTANSSTDALVMPYANDLEVMEISNVPAKTCNAKITPTVKIRNNGTSPVTSCTIKYRVNNGTISSFNWTGNLATMQKVNINLPEYNFGIQSSNDLLVYTDHPNSTADNYPKNDSMHYTIAAAPISTNQIKLVLRTDNLPQETSWEFRNSLGVVVVTSPVYTLANHLYQDTITLPKADCYKFTIMDAGNNGICCANGTGVYEISSNGVIIKQGGQFGASETSEFLMEAPLSLNEKPSVEGFNVYPNPVTGVANVTFVQHGSSEASLSLYTLLGEVVSSQSLGMVQPGQHEAKIDAGNLRPGIYILQLKTNSGIYSRKVTVSK